MQEKEKCMYLGCIVKQRSALHGKTLLSTLLKTASVSSSHTIQRCEGAGLEFLSLVVNLQSLNNTKRRALTIHSQALML